jgi:2,3-bisphosphoglycerate-independent phosphoglycerate mutase
MHTIKKTALLILDGWGIGNNDKVSAIAQANTPFYKSLLANYPHATLLTHGENVGLPEGQMGNSEVGHMNIGAGRVVYQELARINKDMREGLFQKNDKWLDFIQKAQKGNKTIHLLGLVSDGGVHSHISHILDIVNQLKNIKDLKVYIHAFLDGRDTDPKAGVNYLKEIEKNIADSNIKISTIIGRYYAMDRDNRWERTKKAYDLLINGEGIYTDNISKTLKASYKNNVTDEFIEPIRTLKNQEGLIKNEDAVFFVNFRTDRPRQLTKVLTQEDMHEYNMHTLKLDFLTMTKYDASFEGLSVVYEKDNLSNTIGEIIEKNGGSQLRIAETEKYPHVTFFFSAGREKPFNEEYRIMVPSPKVPTYDLQPEMSAAEITEKLLNFLKNEKKVDFICLNFANTDMVGHTGVFSAAKKAAETVDTCVKKIVETIKSDYNIIIIADHGNSDYMINDDGTPNTAHTTNPVPIILISDKAKAIKDGILADVAPTILKLMEISIPKEMTGKVLI